MMWPLGELINWADYGCKDKNPFMCLEFKLTHVICRLHFIVRLSPVFL